MAVRAESGARLRRAARSRPLALAAGLYTLAALVATWPALGSFRSAFIAAGGRGYGEPVAGDHLQTVYRFWLVGHQLERGAPPWRDPYSFQPLVEPQLALGGWPFGLPFWPLEAAFGPVVAWNVLLLAAIVAAGLLAYLWLRALSVGWAGALAGGLAFAIAPYRLEQSAGHLLGWIAVLLPLALLAVERSRAARTRREAHSFGALAAIALVSIPLSGQVHLALGAIPLVVAYAAVRFAGIAAAWSAAGALGTVGVGLAVRYTVIAGSAQAAGRSLSQVESYSAEWVDLLSRWRLGGSEEFVYVGWLTPMLALAGFVLLLRQRRGLAVLLGLAAVLPALLALGTNLPLYSALWHAFPPLRFPRVPGRLMPIADLALAALAGVAVARAVLAAAPRRAAAAGAALLALVAADLTVQPFAASAADPGNAAYAALRPGPDSRILELPLFQPGIHYGSVYHYYGMQAPRERPGGYSTLAPEGAHGLYRRLNRLSCGAWLPGDRGALESLGVRRLLFHAGLYAQAEVPGAWFAWRGLLDAGYRPVARDGGVTLFAPGSGVESRPPVPEPSRVELHFCEGWRGWTMKQRQAALWLWGTGLLELEFSAPGDTRARLWIDGEARPFQIDRRATLKAELRAPAWHVVVVEVPRLFQTKPVRGLRLERLTFPSRGK